MHSNFLFCVIGDPGKDTTLPFQMERDGLTYGAVKMFVSRIPFSSEHLHERAVSETNSRICCLLGYILNSDDLSARYNAPEHDVDLVGTLLDLKGLDCISELDGLFSCISYSVLSKTLVVFQDDYGATTPIFFTQDESRILISSHFPFLIGQLCATEINRDAVKEFFSFRYLVPSSATLIQGVRKLLPRQVLSIDVPQKRVRVVQRSASVRPLSLPRAMRRLVPSVSSRVANIVRRFCPAELAMSLSSGYDTNLLLHSFRKETRAPIKTFTVRGRKVDETPNAVSIVKQYKGVVHTAVAVPADTIHSLPEIIWRLGAHTCEAGIFLQYVLASALYEAKIMLVVLGEGADQQLCRWMPSPLLASLLFRLDLLLESGTPWTLIWSRFLRKLGITRQAGEGSDPLASAYSLFERALPNPQTLVPEEGTLVGQRERDMEFILKKSSMMLNSFGISAIYPFINSETDACGLALGWLNHEKMYYKNVVRGLVGKDISAYLQKRGGGTDVLFLFREIIDDIVASVRCNRYLQQALGNEYLRALLSQRALFDHEDYVANVILTLLYLHIAIKMFGEIRYGDCLRSPPELRLEAFL